MQDQLNNSSVAVSRRQFLKNSTLVAASAAAAMSFPSILNAQNGKQFNAVVIGLGGRGSGAGRDFLDACQVTGAQGKIVAAADIFPDAAASAKDKFGVPADKCFSGFDAYMKAIEQPDVNYVILATPPGFRAPMFRAAVQAGKNVFMEKPVATDGALCRIMYEAAEESKKKGLKVAAGTQRRHQPSYMETVKRIQDGDIGDIVTLRAYWVNTGPIWFRSDRGSTQLEKEIHNWYHYIWLSGDHICEQHVHNLDVCNWIMNDHPVKCWGMGARQQLDGKGGEIWDNFAIEYQYKNGVRMFSYCGQIKRDWGSVSEAVHGTKGTSNPAGSISPKGGQSWRAPRDQRSAYVQEHVDLIQAITNDKELNEAKQVTDSTLTAILGREAAYCGSELEWDQVLNSKFAYGPPQLYIDPSKMTFGDFRVLQPPMPSRFNTIKDPPLVPVANT